MAGSRATTTLVTDPRAPRRILLVTRNLPPLVGGMERLNWHLAAELAQHAEVRVVGPRDSSLPDNVPLAGVPLRPLWKFLATVQWRALREARRWRPDVVLAGSGLTAPAVWLAARACRARAAVYVHGLDLTVAHPIYKLIWRAALRHMDRVIANSTPTRQLAEAIRIRPERIGIVHPGVELPADAAAQAAVGAAEAAIKTSAPMDPGLRQDDDVLPPAKPTPPREGSFRATYKLGERPLLLSVGRLSARKGLREFVSQALPTIAADHPDIVLLVVGDAPSDALHAEAQTPASIRAAAQAHGLGDNLLFLGTITDYAELGAIYRACNVHAFPVRTIPGDPEGFGMVAVEAAAHGLPTVAFATGGIVDAVADGRSGRLVPSGDYAALANAVTQMLATPVDMGPECRVFANDFAWPSFGEQTYAQLAWAVATRDQAREAR